LKRKAFLSYLTRAVSDGFLSEDEATALLRKFDSGEIDDSVLPLPLNEAITTTTEDDIRRGMIALAVLGVIVPGGFKKLTERQQEQTATKLQERFAENVRGYAKQLAESGNLPKWQASMSQTVQEHIIQQSLMGRLRPLTAEEITTLDSVIKTEQAFLSRFADETAARLLQDNPFSEEYIGSRSEQYNGEARAEFFRAKEEDAGEDEVFDYVSVDDNGTCQPCLDAEAASPYLAGEGNFPGSVCDGGGFCRCTRERRIAPDEAAELREGLRAA
jgi:hypothetical protein